MASGAASSSICVNGLRQRLARQHCLDAEVLCPPHKVRKPDVVRQCQGHGNSTLRAYCAVRVAGSGKGGGMGVHVRKMLPTHKHCAIVQNYCVRPSFQERPRFLTLVARSGASEKKTSSGGERGGVRVLRCEVMGFAPFLSVKRAQSIGCSFFVCICI